MTSYLPSSLANPSGREPVDWNLGTSIDNRMPLPPPPPFSSSPPKESSMKPLNKKMASKNFKVMIEWFFSINQGTTPYSVGKLQRGLYILREEASSLPMTLVLHGTQTYDKPDDAYRKAEEATSRFTAAIDLIAGRLNILQPEKSMDPAELKPEEQGQLPQISGCREKGTLHGCLQALYNDFTELLNHFSHPTSPELYDPVLKAPMVRSEISSEECPAWIISTPPWALVPSAIHVLYLSQKFDTHLPKMLIEWIMCMSIRFSNLSRKQGLIPTYSAPMRKVVHLLEDMMKDTLRNDAYNSEGFVSSGLCIEFRELLEKDESIRHAHLDYKKNEELPIIEEMTPSTYSYNLLQVLMPSRFHPSPTSSPSPSQRSLTNQVRKHVLGSLNRGKPKGDALMGAVYNWVRRYINESEVGIKHLPFREHYPKCKDLIGDLIPIAVRKVTKQKPLQEKLEEEVRDFLADRIVWSNRRAPLILEEGKAELSKVTQSVYAGFIFNSNFNYPFRMGLKFCIRDLLYVIYRSYGEHRDMIDSME
ncbi:MAG: hypothetical protein DHS80DRAFT_23556 [Piptocephalis tieghemiana]|nr:MAG: hypothetical protein DHS80DRAFT_23556 [Piptocephalis tieghemiana]